MFFSTIQFSILHCLQAEGGLHVELSTVWVIVFAVLTGDCTLATVVQA